MSSKIETREVTHCSIGETSAGIPVKTVYRPDDLNDLDYYEDLGDPGEFPFTRGIWKNMYRGKLWTKRVFTGLGSVSDSNKRFKFLISRGETGLFCFRDSVCSTGIDPDHPLAEGNAGTDGVSIACLRDMKELFDGIPLEEVSVSFNNSTSSSIVFYAAYITAAEDMGFNKKNLIGSILNEVLHPVSSCFDHGKFWPVDLNMKLAIDVVEYCVKNTPRYHPLVSDGYTLHEKGANAIQELALVMSILKAYTDKSLDRGLDIDEIAPRMALAVLSSDMDFFEEISKFRAARRIWAKIAKHYGAKDPKSYRLYLTSHTSGHSLVIPQPVNNIVRTTVESLACVLGGCQSLDPCGYDEPHCHLSEDGALTALNIQHILSDEARIGYTADPLAGSYFVESLTGQIEALAHKIIEEIDGKGGMIDATKHGFIRNMLEEESQKEWDQIGSNERPIVGLNRHTVAKEQEVPIRLAEDTTCDFEHMIQTSNKVKERIIHLKETRDIDRARHALENLRDEAKKGDKHNLIPAIINTLRADATLGEILGMIRLSNGLTYDPLGTIPCPF